MQSTKTGRVSAVPLLTPSMVSLSGIQSKKIHICYSYIESKVFFVEAGSLEGDQIVNGHFPTEENCEVAHVLIKDSL
jgi:hypothetical protein